MDYETARGTTLAMVEEVARQLHGIVQAVERSVPREDKHGEYVKLLRQAPDDQRRKIMAMGMVEAGGDREIIKGALEDVLT